MGIADIGVVLGLALPAAAVLVAIAFWAWTAWARGSDKRQAAAAQTTAERLVAEKLVHWLEGRRVLWNPMTKEIPEEAIESVVMIRERIDEDFGGLRHPTARQELGAIRGACIELLNEPRGSFRGFFSHEGQGALQRFRDRVRPAVEAFAATYTVEPPKWPDYRGGFEDQGIPIYIPPPPDQGGSA